MDFKPLGSHYSLQNRQGTVGSNLYQGQKISELIQNRAVALKDGSNIRISLSRNQERK